MRGACANVASMTKMIQIRNVPDDLHRRLKVRAAGLGMTLSDYLLSEVASAAEKPTLEEMLERLRTRETAQLDERPEESIRQHRNA
ncbi:antitoxin [soil metagenome]